MATPCPLSWLDGQLVRTEDAGIALTGHAVQRGSLVFDVCSFRPAARGPALFRARDHAERFLRSSGLVGLELSFGVDDLVVAAARVLGQGKGAGFVRWSGFFRAREPDLTPRDRGASVAVSAFTFDDPPGEQLLRVAVFDDARKAGPDVISPEVKASGIYLGPFIARERAARAGANDVVLLDQDGDVAEAPTANVFAVISGTLVTPPLGRVLPGVTRRTVLELAREEGIPVREERLRKAELLAADEAFLTATTIAVSPIGSVNDRAFPAAPGPITRRLAQRLDGCKRGEDPTRTAWLTYPAPA